MQLPKSGTIEIVPSILNADFGKMADELAFIADEGMKIIQFDVMDGHFVPNISFGPPVIESLRKYSSLCFDVQLMISEPQRYIKDFVQAGADHITFHIETVDDPLSVIKQIHDFGISAGIAINPDTPIDRISDFIKHCQMVLVMTVEPGFGGQDFLKQSPQRIKQIRQIAGPGIRLQVDGGINPESIETAVISGSDTLVIGSAIFKAEDKRKALANLKLKLNQLIEEGKLIGY